MNQRKHTHQGRLITLSIILIIVSTLLGRSGHSLAEPAPHTDPPFETIELPEDARSWLPERIEGLRPEQKHPKLDTHLQNLVDAAEGSAREALVESGALRFLDGRVQVQISTSADNLLAATLAVEKAGGWVTKTSNDGTFFQAWLPIDAIIAVAEHPYIDYIRRPHELITLNEVNTGSQTTEGLAAMNGDAWHTDGILGTGAKVAIIDGGFEGYISLLGTDLPSTVTVKNFVDGQTDADVNTSDGIHGLACAEIVFDIAPQAQLYLAKIATGLDLQEAVTWAIDNNVDIISTSFGFYNATPGDGTGFLEDLVHDARSAGVLWVTAAGNNRKQHWGGLYSDPNGNNWHNFSQDWEINYFGPGDETAYAIPDGFSIVIYLRWDDWTLVDQDYDLYLYRWTGSDWALVAFSENVQDGNPGQTPTERIYFVTTETTASIYGFAISRWDSTRDVNLEVFVPTVPHLNFYLYDRSLPNLADAASAMSTGAVDVVSPYDQEVYSSQGPTNGPGGTETGGFIKPDIAAYARVSTVSYGSTNFAGTSSATAHVAGAAALALSAYPSYTPDQLQTFLEGRAIDMGTAGMDNIYGHGRLHLGDPPTSAPPPIVGSITPNTGENTGPIDVTISGSNFVSGATVKLTKSGQPNINATSVNVSSSTQISCTLNLSGAAAGAWNVIVTNPDTQSGTLTNGFMVTEPSGTGPVITLDPQEISSTQVSNVAVNKYLQIGNTGGANLNWNVYQGTVGGQSILPLSTTTAIEGSGSQTLTIGDDLLAFSALDAEGTSFAPPPPIIDADQLNITHSGSQTITSGNSVACSPDGGATTSANQYLRTFTLADFGITQDFAVEQVSFGIQNLTSTRDITVNLYTLNGDFINANLTKIGTTTTSLAAQSLSLVNVPVSANAPAGSTLVVEIAAGDFSSEDAFFIGSNDLGQTAPSYITAVNCGLTEPTDLASIGFSNMHIVMSVTGSVGETLVCDAPGSVGWVNVAPLSGVVAPTASQSVDVAFDSTALSVNTYTANLCISSNDPAQPLSVVPLSLTVQPTPAPTIDGITPDTGDNTGPIDVTINGNNFDSGAAVKLTKTGHDEIIATGLWSSTTQITCNFDLTGAATGDWNVVVTNPDEQSNTLLNGFTVTLPVDPAPSVTSITPNTGENTGPIDVTITGTNFKSETTVKLTKSGQSDIITTNVIVHSATQLSCNLDLTGAAAGAWNVVVTNPDEQTGTLLNGFKVTSSTGPGTWIVDTLADSGTGSLREALANAAAGDRIEFDAGVFPPEAPGVIKVTSNILPTIRVDYLTIDAVGRGVILDGDNQISRGLGLIANNTVIQGLELRNFVSFGIYMSGATQCLIGGDRALGQGNVINGNASGYGIMLDGLSTNDNVIAGNIIGADHIGMSPMPNSGGVLIRQGAKRNTIGGLNSGYANLISGNTGTGINIIGNGTDHNVIQGNLIGTDLTGEAALGNGGTGIAIQEGPDHTLIGGDVLGARNIIAGNGGRGIYIGNISTNYTQVLGNYVGINQSGTQGLPNHIGIFIDAYAMHTQIGGNNAAMRNVISGNNSLGILIQKTSDTFVQGNYIGTDPSGTTAIPNSGNGIEIVFQGNNTIGGPNMEDHCAGDCNLISGNLGVGIAVYQSKANTIQGNYVGSDWTGEKYLGNGQVGLRLNLSDTVNNKIGGEGAGAGNLIRFNQGGGVTLTASTSRNELTGNRIENNDGVAIRYHPGNILGVNHCSGNDPNLVEVWPGPLYSGDDQRAGETWLAQGDLTRFVVVDYRGLGNDIIVQPGSTWTVGPGVEVLFDFNEGAWINGHLEVQGTRDNPVIFGSAQRYTAPMHGDWLGMAFKNDSSGSLSHTTVEFARTGISVEGAYLSLSNSIITASEQDGLHVGAGSTLHLDGNTIAGNGRYGIYNPHAITINAQGTWWGHASGPDGGLNGQGDAVEGDQVDYSNWLTDPGFNDSWILASVLNPGTHSFAITSYQDLDWFRVPVGTRNATVTASLSQLPRDYDLFMFSQLGAGRRDVDDLARTMTIGQTALLGNLDVASQTVTLARTMTIGQLADVVDGFETGNMVGASSHPGTVDEEISIDVWNRTGWYYILVAGHNGANSPQEYLLHITITPGLSMIEPGFEPPTFDPPKFVAPEIKTLILTHRSQLEARFGPVGTLMDKLEELAGQSEVAGSIIELNLIKAIDDTYTLWSENPNNPVYANLVAGAIRAWLDVNRTAYPNLEYLVIVGGDGIVPFWRVPDEVPLAHEGTYEPHLAAGSPTGTALAERYFLTDDYYGGFTLIPWRGRELVFPEFGIGRLVETPMEMMAAIDAFIDTPILDATTALVTGYEFMKDGAEAMADPLAESGLSVTRLIDDGWTAEALRTQWLVKTHDINAINAHFEHWKAIPADPLSGAITSEQVVASNTLIGTLNYSIGCHSGLHIPDGEATAYATDFPQALLGRGAAWIANTGYGYGDADAVGYSELLMTLFSQNMAQGHSLGHALRAAKAEYFNGTGIYSFSPYDEKVLAQATLYGLPMQRISMPASTTSAKDANEYGQLSVPGRANGLVTRQVIFDLVYETHSDPGVGTYFSVGGETEVNEWQPIQPRTSLDISLEGETPHGAFFEGGTYETIENFDPVISRLVSTAPDMAFQEGEPTFDHPNIWLPSWWSLVNRVWIDESVNERLVVIPAQYQSTTPTNGTQRLFDQMNYTVYYSNKKDIVPPSIWRVNAFHVEAEILFTVEVTDLSDLIRVGISYTLGDGIWETIDLVRKTDKPNLWSVTMPYEETIEWFVQAVDGTGNVAVNDNKGAYFGPPTDPPTELNWIWLPLILR